MFFENVHLNRMLGACATNLKSQSIDAQPNFHHVSLDNIYKQNGLAFYWDGIVITWYLCLTSTSLIDNFVGKYCAIQSLCICFLIIQIIIKPYKSENANRTEALALFLVIAGVHMNSMGASFLDGGILLAGPFQFRVIMMEISKIGFPFFIILFITVQQIFQQAVMLKNKS